MVGYPPAIPVPDVEKLKTLFYQLFADFGQARICPVPAADNAGAAVCAGWFTVC
jgi:hypothetical protein